MEEKKYKFGIIKRVFKREGNTNTYFNVGICSCGQQMRIDNNRFATTFDCDHCGNTLFINAIKQSRERFVIPYFEILRKDNRGFMVKRINLSVKYDGNFVKPVKENLVRTIDYDIVDKRLIVTRNDEVVFDYEKDGWNNAKVELAQRFFIQLETTDFIEIISNETTRGLFSVVNLLSRNWSKKDDVILGLIKLFRDHSYLQILSSAGIPNVERFYESSRKCVDFTKTKPHEILKIPKALLKYIREDLTIDAYALKEIHSMTKVDGNSLKEIMEIAKDESGIKSMTGAIERILQIHTDYGYQNLKKLVLYLVREVRLYQGIPSPLTASTLLRDYVRMSTTMGLDYERYPKSLKKEHDVMQMNYKVIEDKLKQQAFKNSVEKPSYQNLILVDKDFSVISPETSDDLVREGNQLSHCVASYVNDITNDRCKILFLRRTEDIEKPLATIEVRGLNIRQARGYANHAIGKEERNFIKKWAEKNELVEAYY